MIRPLGNRIIVRRIVPQQLGSIHLPESLKDDFNIGGPKEYLVMAVGPGKRDKKGNYRRSEVRTGDRVICHSYTAGPQELGNGDFYITDDIVIAIVPNQYNERTHE